MRRAIVVGSRLQLAAASIVRNFVARALMPPYGPRYRGRGEGHSDDARDPRTESPPTQRLYADLQHEDVKPKRHCVRRT